MSYFNNNNARNVAFDIDNTVRSNMQFPMQQYYLGHYGSVAATFFQIVTSLPALCTNGMDLISKLKGSNSTIDQRNFKNIAYRNNNMNDIINKYR